MKKVISMCPFMGLSYEDENGNIFYKGEGLIEEENERLDNYFAQFFNQPFNQDKSTELAQMALDNVLIPKNWRPNDL